MKDVIIEKLTNLKWLNMFRTERVNAKGHKKEWFFASRNEDPQAKNGAAAVVIIPIVEVDGVQMVAMIREYRDPLFDWEHGFPAGLIDPGDSVEDTVRKELKQETGLDMVKMGDVSNPIYSSAGLTDEACVMVFVRAEGELSIKYQEDSEEIEPYLIGITGVRHLLASGKKIGAKSWGILYHFAVMGDFSSGGL